ncbi:unnamed protein product, partial [Brenthis ino]
MEVISSDKNSPEKQQDLIIQAQELDAQVDPQKLHGVPCRSKKEHDYVTTMISHPKNLKEEEHKKRMPMALEEHINRMEMAKEEHMKRMEMAKNEHMKHMEMAEEEHKIKLEIHQEKLKCAKIEREILELKKACDM